MTRTIGQTELAGLLGLSTRQISNLRAKGMPAKPKGNAHEYPVPEAIQWYVQWKAEAAAAASKPSNIEEAKLQLVAAQAQIEELKLEELRKSLLKREEAARWFEDACQRVRGHLLPLAQKLAPRVVGVRTVQEALAAIQPIVDEVMDELHRADDVPGAAVEEAA